MKKVAVTGGTGFLGYHMVPALERAGFQVKLLKRGEVDFSDEGSIEKACEGSQFVIHAAGLVSYDRADQQKMWETNVALTQRMLRAAKRVGVRRFEHVSSIVTIGHGIVPRTEESPFNAKELKLAYWTTKAEGESIALAANAKDFEVVVSNPGALLGEGEKNNQLGPFIKKLARNERPFLPAGGSDFLDGKDAGEGCVLVLEKGRPGERYILGSENLSYAELHKRIRAAMGLQSRPRIVPAGLLKTAEKILVGFEWLTRLDPPVNSLRVRRVNGVYMFHDCSKAKKELGYAPAPIDRALRVMLDRL